MNRLHWAILLCASASLQFMHSGDGFIDKTGKAVIEARYSDALSFSEGLAPVRVGMKYFRLQMEIMRPRLFSVFLGGLVLSGSSATAQSLQQHESSQSKPSKKYKGTLISVETVGKTKAYKDDFGRKMTAKPGYDIVVVKLKFIMPSRSFGFEKCRLNMEIEATSKETTILSSAGNEETCEILFGVPEGTAIKTFEIDDIIFDLLVFGVK